MFEDNEEKIQQSEYSRENQDHLDRLEQEYLQDLENAKFIKSWLQSLMFNSFNVFLTLYCIHLGLSIFLSCFAGFTIGCIPGVKKIGENININKTENIEMNINGKVIQGFLKIIIAGVLTYSASSEWNNILKISEMANSFFRQDTISYEKEPVKTKDDEFKWILLTVLGSAAGVMIYKLAKDN